MKAMHLLKDAVLVRKYVECCVTTCTCGEPTDVHQVTYEWRYGKGQARNRYSKWQYKLRKLPHSSGSMLLKHDIMRNMPLTLWCWN